MFFTIDSSIMQLQRPALVQTQKFTMNTQLYQSIKIMELPIVELREKIEEELEKNPALEILEDRSTISLDAATNPPKEEDDYFESSSDSGFVTKGGEAAADERQRFLEGVLTHSETLQEHLLWQLQLEPVDGDLRRICELLIQNLDLDGFHKEPVDVLLKNENPENIQKALKFVQELDPVGACTADYKESLRVQVELLPDAPKGILEALSCLDLLERGKNAEAARQIGCSEKEIGYIFERLKELSPFPGRRFSSGDTRFVVPDIQVVQKEGDFVIILNEEEIPVLGINPFFMKIMGEPLGFETEDETERHSHSISARPFMGDPLNMTGLNSLQKANFKKQYKPVRDFARENIKEARWFINSINQRNHTLLRVTRAIVEFQRSFFMNGPKYLAPLTLRDIAQEIGVHEATVSRTANGKYVQTEWGIFELRYFFSNSIKGTGSGGSKYSKGGVKEIIREIIETESRRLSDHDIVGILAKRGILLARRTVAKYRSELDLGPSFVR